MKNIILGLLLIFTLHSFAQNNFRDMSWGDSVAQLKNQYPNVKWEIITEEKIKLYAMEDYVGGLKATVAYGFVNNKLQIGSYYFMQEHTSDNLHYEDFKNISDILNKKYDMELNEKWNDDQYKNRPSEIGYALSIGHVEIEELYEDENTFINHNIGSEHYGKILHMLIYSDMDFIKSKRDSVLDDF